MTTTEVGHRAELAAAAYLADHYGLKLISQNWRTRWHKVDLVMSGPRGLHFIEVKYRRTINFGSGLDYLTPAKLARLRRAVLYWQQRYGYEGLCQIDGLAATGPLTDLVIDYRPNIG